MQIELVDNECSELRLLLEDALGQLSHEIADTDNALYRRGLRSRRTALDAVARRLGQPSGAQGPEAGVGQAPGGAPSEAPTLGSMWIDGHGSEVLPRNECLRLVALAAHRGDTGRLGISMEGAPIVVPANFGYHDTKVLLRLGSGTLADLVAGSLVAFEVDHVDRQGGLAWSVLVRGLATPLSTHDLHLAWRHVPEPLAPRPGDLLMSIRSDVVTGRRFALDPVDDASPSHS
jgi:hypothetical protein